MPSSTPPRKKLNPETGADLAAVSVLIGYTVLAIILMIGKLSTKQPETTSADPLPYKMVFTSKNVKQ